LPGLIGADLVNEVHKYYPKIPVILCTGFSEKIDAGKAVNLGFAGFLMKPVVLQELDTLVREVLDRKLL
jgi:DNA-binding NtrC family response regulator